MKMVILSVTCWKVQKFMEVKCFYLKFNLNGIFMVTASAFPVLSYSDNISRMTYLPLFQGSLYSYKNSITFTFRKYDNVYKLSFHPLKEIQPFPNCPPTPACDSTQRVLYVFIFLFLVKVFSPLGGKRTQIGLLGLNVLTCGLKMAGLKMWNCQIHLNLSYHCPYFLFTRERCKLLLLYYLRIFESGMEHKKIK